jgi:hypothetical protein
VKAEFGNGDFWSNEEFLPRPFSLGISDFTGNLANWIGVNMAYDNVSSNLRRIIAVAARHGLVVFDLQTEYLHGISA